MKNLLILYAALLLLAGCSTTRQSKVDVELVTFEPNRVLLTISRQEWDGLFGPCGYVGFRGHYYAFHLKGSGPVFENPKVFNANSSGHTYRATVTLDTEHQKATLNVREILSKEGEPERSRRHSISGTYMIDEVREATSADRFGSPDSTW